MALAAIAGIAAVSAIAQAYQSEKARGANQKELNRIKATFEAIVPPEYDVSVNDPPELIMERLPPADLDFSRITPEDYQVIGTYAPESAQFVAEANPTLLEGSAAAKEGRGAQIEALRQFQKIARGESPELKIKLEEAARNAQIASQSRQASALQDAQRRGTASGGLSFASSLQGASDAMVSGAQQGQLAALQAYKDKLAATEKAAGMGRNLAADEFNVEGRNADIINSFNQRTSRSYQDYLNQRSALANEAQLRNLQTGQEIANKNVAQRNEADRYNLENKNRLAQQAYGNAANERNYQNTLRTAQAQWAADEKDRQNRLKSQSYSDQMNRASGMSKIGMQQIGMNTQNAQDRNNMIQGVAQAGAGYFQQKAADQREADRWAKIEALMADNQPSYGSSSVNWDDDTRNKYRGMA